MDGKAWLLRALRRAEEQARQEGRSLEEVAAERWGSLDKLMTMINDKDRNSGNSGSSSDNKGVTFRPLHRDSSRQFDSKQKLRFAKPVDEPGPKRSTKSGPQPSDRYVDVEAHYMKSQPDGSAQGSNLVHSKPITQKLVRRMGGWSGKDFMSAGLTNDGREEERSPSLSSSASADANTPNVFPTGGSSDDLNKLNARLFKAEMAGKTKLVKKLKAQIEATKAGASVSSPISIQGSTSGDESKARCVDDDTTDTDVLLRIDPRSGLTVPFREKRPSDEKSTSEKSSKSRKKDRVDRIDDSLSSSQSIREMFEEEKMTSSEDAQLMFASKAGQSAASMRTDDDFTIDDALLSKQRPDDPKKAARLDRERAVANQRRMDQRLATCRFCLNGDKYQKHLTVATGQSTYLMAPAQKSLTEGHCVIRPMDHVSSAAQLDEDVWSEIKGWQTRLTSMFRRQKKAAIFMETATKLYNSPHMAVDCVPVPERDSKMAPAYFKKAILECEGEWLNNKRLIPLSTSVDLRRAIPQGFSYFAVIFDDGTGFAHVVEHEGAFPYYFGKEIIAGLLEMDDPSLWRRPPLDDFSCQLNKVGELRSFWKPFDLTYDIDRLDETYDNKDSAL